MNAKTATKAYAAVEIESGVHSADPHKLISMLYQGALLSITNAKNAILRKDISAKGEAISKALLIIGDGLQASLNKEVGGELAQNLNALYSYMSTRLLSANLGNDMVALDEVAGLLNELKSAWDSIGQTTNASMPKAAPMVTPSKQPALVYGRM